MYVVYNYFQINAFYIGNMHRDLFYLYGFDENAGNFQKENFDKDGLGNDAMKISVQNPNTVNGSFSRWP